jgi:PAS domain S-box-containing protein
MDWEAVDKSGIPRTILVVEDDDGLLKLIVKSLKKSGFNPIGVSTGAQAIEYVVSNRKIILLLDQQLPDMTGRDIINSLNIRNLSVPFIVMTGQGDERLAVEMMKLGAEDYLVKDTDFLDILPGALDRLYKTIEIEQRLIAAEDALRQSELLLSESQKIGHIGSWKFDLANNKLIWSDEAFRIFGIDPKVTEASYEVFLNLVHPDDRIAVDTAYINSIKENKDSYEIEHRIILHQNNEIRFVLEKCNHQRNKKGIHIQSVGIVQDITESKKAEIALKKMEAMHSKMIANIGDVVVIVDANGLNKYNSPNIEKLFGWLPEDLVESEAMYTVHPADRESVQELIRSISTEPNATGNIECRYMCKNGSYTWIAITVINLLHDPDIHGFLGNYHNISDRKKMECDLVSAKEKAEESDRLKTAFLQNMSHEIRTPLNSICGFSEMLNNNITNEKRTHFSGIILSSSHQLLSVVNDILTVSALETKQEFLNIEKVCINNIIIEMQAIFNQQATKKAVSFDTVKSLTNQQSEIFTDKPKITQILTNLISNALKFTPKGTIQFGYYQNNNELQFFVKDTGIGIDKNKVEIIFNRFVQADDTIRQDFGGTGLGLSICRGFVDLLGGKIWAESELGKGSTFYFTIPYKPVIETNLNSESAMLQNDTTQNTGIKPAIIKVLVAEDQEINFIYVEEVLSELNCTILHATNGQEAVDLCKANEDIDLILMDIKMPVMDGYTAAQLIKTFRPLLPIVAQTAYALEKEIEKYSKVFDDYVTKPITTEKLLKTTANYLNIKSSI